MGQYDILDFLAKNPDTWFSAEEIKKALKSNVSCFRPIMKLRNFGMIDFKFEKRKDNKCGIQKFYFYKHKS